MCRVEGLGFTAFGWNMPSCGSPPDLVGRAAGQLDGRHERGRVDRQSIHGLAKLLHLVHEVFASYHAFELTHDILPNSALRSTWYANCTGDISS